MSAPADLAAHAAAIAARAHDRVARERAEEAAEYRRRFPEFFEFLRKFRAVFGDVKVKRIEVFETGEVIEPKRRPL